MKQKHIRTRSVFLMGLLIFVAVVIEMNILGFINKSDVNNTAQILLNQIDGILAENEQTEKNILADLKVEYVKKAKTVAFLLESDESLKKDGDGLRRISRMLDIDEINFFDSNGLLFGGTNPEYYGISFDSGEQVAFFKPMLNDRQLTMCQDVTPNTALSKHMMYAITWASTQSYMVQVGIEPVRLLNALKDSSISEVLKNIPLPDGSSIYISKINGGDNGLVLSSAGNGFLADGKSTLYDWGFLDSKDDPTEIESKTVYIKGYRHYCHFMQHGDLLVTTVQSTKPNLRIFLVCIIIEVVWLLVAGSFIIRILFKLASANRKIKKQMKVVNSISKIYYSMHLIDIPTFHIEKLEGNELMDKVVHEGRNAQDMLQRIVKATVGAEFVDAALAFTDLKTLPERMKGRKSISMDVVDKRVGWLRVSFIVVDTDEDDLPLKVIIATQVIDEDKKREEELSIEVHRDELTGLFNRRAYEDDLLKYPKVPVEADFVYAAIDINGLKVVNDEMGHAAGDELICGAAQCLKQTLGNYGRVYRTGGDEFVSMFFADEVHLQEVRTELEKVVDQWQGKIVPELSLSVGYASKQEFPNEAVVDMAKVADKRMYEAKAKYYSHKGVDRRGQAAAHKALCNLYTKILKVNLTEDTYSIVNMDMNEQNEEMGFAPTLSQWLNSFGKQGMVHPEDLSTYHTATDIGFLKDYFARGNSSIDIFYRRKFGEEYKKVVMEMIPSDDYSDEDQSLFLYVKTTNW